MAENPLTISPTDDNKYIMKFSKDEFSDFVFSLLATPRQERRIYRRGFDLKIADTKSLIEKILHKVETDHDVLHKEFAAEVIYVDERRLSYSSADQFFSTSDVSNDEIEQMALTLSVVIPFNRAGKEKSYEKQTIYVLINAGQIGCIEVDIRSTEISWPAGYFDLIDKHFEKLTRSIPSVESVLLNLLLFLHPFFKSDFLSNSKTEESANWNDRVRMAMLATLAVLATSTVNLSSSNSNINAVPRLFNQETFNVEGVDLSQLVDEVGWREAASLLHETQTLLKLDDIEYAKGEGPKPAIHAILGSVWGSKVFLGLLLGMSFFTLANAFYARALASEQAGRIFLYNDNIPARPKGKILFAVFGSAIVGAFGSALATAIFSLF